MSAVTEEPAAAPAASASRGGSLFGAEVHRFRSRRFIHVLLGVAVLICGFATVIGLLNVGTPTDADYSAAQAQLEQTLADAEQGRQQCLEDPGPIPDDVTVEEWCGPEVTEVLASRSTGDMRVRVPDAAAAAGMLAGAGFAVSPPEVPDGQTLLVHGVAAPGEVTRALAQQGVFLEELTPMIADLESAFLAITGAPDAAEEPGTDGPPSPIGGQA